MTSSRSIVAAFAALALVGCGAGAAGDVASTRQPQGVVVTPTLTGPNGPYRLVCADLGPALNQLYTDVISFEGATFPYVLDFADTDENAGPLEVELTFSSAKMFSWKSNIGVDYVLVGDSGSLDTNVYAYDPEATAGADLVAPHESDVYYVKLCYDPGDDGCTYTLGYWKTHSVYGPAKKADATWEQIGDPKQVEFFSSGMTYYDVLWTPVAGNPYFILARQFIAARLNLLAGAASGDVEAAMSDAEALLTGLALEDAYAERAELVRLAGLLGAFNEGDIGPGHCAE